MKQTVKVIYENGVFRHLKTPEISDRQKVRLIVETPSVPTPEKMLELAAQVYQGLAAEQIDEIDKIALERAACASRNRHDFFG